MNACVERFVQTIQFECLDHFVAVGQKHHDYLVCEFVNNYHTLRPHQNVGNLTLDRAATDELVLTTIGEVVCDERLGGLLKSFGRAA